MSLLTRQRQSKWLMGKVGQSSFSLSQGWLQCYRSSLPSKKAFSTPGCEEGVLSRELPSLLGATVSLYHHFHKCAQYRSCGLSRLEMA